MLKATTLSSTILVTKLLSSYELEFFSTMWKLQVIYCMPHSNNVQWQTKQAMVATPQP